MLKVFVAKIIFLPCQFTSSDISANVSNDFDSVVPNYDCVVLTIIEISQSLRVSLFLSPEGSLPGITVNSDEEGGAREFYT